MKGPCVRVYGTINGRIIGEEGRQGDESSMDRELLAAGVELLSVLSVHYADKLKAGYADEALNVQIQTLSKRLCSVFEPTAVPSEARR